MAARRTPEAKKPRTLRRTATRQAARSDVAAAPGQAAPTEAGVQSGRGLSTPRALQLLLVAAVALGVYANTLANAFVNDDEHQVLMNPWILDLRQIPTIFSSSVWSFVSSRTTTDYYRPVMHLVYLVNFHLFGYRAWGFHLVNALFHAANTALVFIVAERLVRAASRVAPAAPASPATPTGWFSVPLVAALLFAAHPIHTEAVAWIASVPELAMTLFCLAALALYLREDGLGEGRWWPPWILFSCALLSKETAVTLVGILAAFDLALGRSRHDIRALWRRWLPYLLALAAYLLVRHRVLAGTLVRQERLWDLTPLALVLSALDLFRAYLAALLLPVGLSFWHTFRPVHTALSPAGLLALLISGIFGAAGWWAWKRNRLVAFGLGLLVIPLAPAFYIAALPAKPYAERYLYLPSVGFVLVVAVLLDHFGRRQRARLALTGLVLLVTALFAVATVRRNRIWQDALTLYTDTARRTAGAPVPPIALAAELLKRGHHREAIAQFRILAQVEPQNATYRSALGNALLLDGQVAEALAHLRAAFALDPRSLETQNDLALALRRDGKPAEAIATYRQALGIDPNFVAAHFNLASALGDAGDIAGALEHYRAAVRLRPGNAYYRSVLGIELARQGELAAALEQFEEAVRLEPHEPAYQKNLDRARGLVTAAPAPP